LIEEPAFSFQSQLEAVRQLGCLSASVGKNMRGAIRGADLVLACLDGLIGFASIVLSFMVRFDLGPVFRGHLPQLLAVGCIAAFLKPGILLATRLYAVYWRYVSAREVFHLFAATATASIALALATMLLQSPFPSVRGIPLAIFLVDFLASTLAMSSLRFILHIRLARDLRPNGRV
jgi:FlaA1/EpsC-like NDP-sugar epimerase